MLSEFSEPNIIGLDYGLQYMCAVLLGRVFGKIQVHHLYFDESHNCDILPLIYSEEPESKKAILGECCLSNCYQKFSCFLRPPGADMEPYGGNSENPTYRTLTTRFFTGAVRQLFQINCELNRYKHTLLVVGCPGGRDWDLERYQRQLSQALRVPEYSGDIRVLVRPYLQGLLSEDSKCTLHLDLGERYLYAQLWKDGGCRDVRWVQIEAIEELMLDLIFAEGAEVALQSVDAREAMHRDLCAQLVGGVNESALEFILRKKKELLFVAHGEDQTDQYLKIILAGKDKTRTLKSLIDEDFMRRVIYQIPIRTAACSDDSAFAGAVKKIAPSFYDAARSFLQKVAESAYKADHVLVTGANAAIQPIHTLVQEQFHSIPIVEADPFSFAEGLAMLGVKHLQAQAEEEKQTAPQMRLQKTASRGFWGRRFRG